MIRRANFTKAAALFTIAAIGSLLSVPTTNADFQDSHHGVVTITIQDAFPESVAPGSSPQPATNVPAEAQPEQTVVAPKEHQPAVQEATPEPAKSGPSEPVVTQGTQPSPAPSTSTTSEETPE